MAFTKDMALELLSKGNILEFNTERPYDEEDLFDLSELDFTGYILAGANLSLCDLNGADFTEMELTEINFSNSDLTSASFIRAKIVESDFSSAILNGASFVGATCFANFSDADLSGADFSEGDFSESDFSIAVNMSLCKFGKYTVWPDSSDLPDDFDSEYIPDESEDEDDLPKTEGYY